MPKYNKESHYSLKKAILEFELFTVQLRIRYTDGLLHPVFCHILQATAEYILRKSFDSVNR